MHQQQLPQKLEKCLPSAVVLDSNLLTIVLLSVLDIYINLTSKKSPIFRRGEMESMPGIKPRPEGTQPTRLTITTHAQKAKATNEGLLSKLKASGFTLGYKWTTAITIPPKNKWVWIHPSSSSQQYNDCHPI